MKRLFIAVLSTVFILGSIASGYAEQGDWRGGIRSRIQTSQQRIDQGINQGTLNRREADRLNAELGAILNKIERMRADGYLDPGERNNIINDLDRLDRDIYKEKHDAVSTVPVVVQVDWRGGIRSRIQTSQQRIDQGINQGTLNRREADRLNAELGAILNKIERMRADGYLDPGERNNIINDLDRLDRDIYKEKHDAVSTVPVVVQVDWRGGIRSRIQTSQQRIDQGINDGTLNRYEARKLNKELGRILQKIDRMRSDGSLSQGERNRINRDLDRLDRNIFKDKNDNNRRY